MLDKSDDHQDPRSIPLGSKEVDPEKQYHDDPIVFLTGSVHWQPRKLPQPENPMTDLQDHTPEE